MRTHYWTRLALAAGLLLSALSGCHDQPDVAPTPNLGTHTGWQAATAPDVARAWYEAPPSPAYGRRLCNLQWADSRMIHDKLLMTPIFDHRFANAPGAARHFYRRLVTTPSEQGCDGMIIEVVERGTSRTPEELDVLFETLYYAYATQNAAAIDGFDGYAAYYNRENFFQRGLVYLNGVPQSGEASMKFVYHSQGEPHYDNTLHNMVVEICWVVSIHHFVYMDDAWVQMACYSYPVTSGNGGSGGSGSVPGGSYPVGGGSTPGPNWGSGGGSGSGGSSGPLPDPPVNNDDAGYGGYNPNIPLYTPGPVAPDPEDYNCNELRDFHGEPAHTLNDFVNANLGVSRFGIINQRFNNTTQIPVPFPDGSTRIITLEGGPTIRYVRDPLNTDIVIDLRHMLVVGRMGRAAGESIELYQAVTMQESALNHQDYYSNELGYSFYNRYSALIENEPTRLAEYLNIFLRNPGGRVHRTDPAVVNLRCP